MVTSYVLLEAIFASATGLPEDDTIMTWAFQSDVNTPENTGVQAAANLVPWYNTGNGAAHDIAWYMSNQILRGAGASRWRAFDVTGHLDGSATGRPPLFETTWTLDPGADVLDLPSEVAVCNSFHSAGVFGEGGHTGPRPAARHRGRNYLGPLNIDAVNGSPAVSVVNPDLMTAIQWASSRSDINTGNVRWSVWSRANAAMYPVTGGFVDDAFDTQRRRGQAPTTRLTWP